MIVSFPSGNTIGWPQTCDIACYTLTARSNRPISQTVRALLYRQKLGSLSTEVTYLTECDVHFYSTLFYHFGTPLYHGSSPNLFFRQCATHVRHAFLMFFFTERMLRNYAYTTRSHHAPTSTTEGCGVSLAFQANNPEPETRMESFGALSLAFFTRALERVFFDCPRSPYTTTGTRADLVRSFQPPSTVRRR